MEEHTPPVPTVRHVLDLFWIEKVLLSVYMFVVCFAILLCWLLRRYNILIPPFHGYFLSLTLHLGSILSGQDPCISTLGLTDPRVVVCFSTENVPTDLDFSLYKPSRKAIMVFITLTSWTVMLGIMEAFVRSPRATWCAVLYIMFIFVVIDESMKNQSRDA
ncbi:hypothetical protein SLS55_010284 [Diplodia seriata]|uniref:Uncharacterized protein n=1 Tax=Diplodia seriata TaxID=420778 RepID=A0ABR3C0L0_9PEZI